MTAHAKVLTAVILILALGMLTSSAEAINIPTGPWTIIGNGFFGTLQINSIDGTGLMNVSAYGNITVGLYNNVSNTILFTRQFGPGPDSVQQYQGALMTLPAGGSVCTYVFTGTFSGYAPSGGTGTRNSFAWAAFINGTCP